MQSMGILEVFALCYRRCDAQEWTAAENSIFWQDFMPSYEDFITFADSHYVGGLAGSVVAVESLFRVWSTSSASEMPFARREGLYNSEHAAHMRYLYERYDIRVPDPTLPPDHLSNLLLFLQLLVEHAPPADVCMFIDEHLNWLPAYRRRITERAAEVTWPASLTGMLIDYLRHLKERFIAFEGLDIQRSDERERKRYAG